MGYMEENGMEMHPKLTLTLCDKTLRSEVSEDYTLPDYQPEIRRILHVIPTVLPPAKYVGNGNVEWNGAVDYQVFYVGGDGGLYTLSLSTDYGGQIPLEETEWLDLSEGVTVLVTTVAESVNTRVSGPRKLNLRCRLCSKIRAYGSLSLDVREMGVRDDGSLQRHYGECGRMDVFGGVSDGISCTDEIMGIEPNARVISATAESLVEHVRKEADGLHVTGEVDLHVMLEGENGTAETLLRKLPLDGVMEWNGAEQDPCIRSTVSDVQLHVEEGKILCEVNTVLEGRSMEERPVAYVDDAYSLEREGECKYGNYHVPTVLFCGNGNFSQSERISSGEANLPEGANLLQCFGNAWFEECKLIDGTYLLCGKSRYVLLFEKGGEYGASELVLPIRYEIKGVDEASESFDATASMMGSRVRLEGETLCIDTEWSVGVELVGGRDVSVLREIQLGEQMPRRESAMTVYYPAIGDTPWSVAKKYHVPVESIAEGAAYYFF